MAQFIFERLSLSERSPYTIAGGVQEMFFGRELEYALIKGISENIGIFGPRTIGKTSLLMKLYHDIKDDSGWMVYALDCARVENEEALLKNLAEKMDVKFSQISDMDKFRKYVTQKTEKEKKQFLFLLDGVDRLIAYDTRNDDKIFRTFNSMCNETLETGEAAARFILFGFREMYEQMKNPESRLYNFMVFLPLKSLDRKSAYQLVTRPMRDIHVKWENEEQDANFLVDQCSGHPLLLQAACHALLQILDNKTDMITIIERKDIDKVFRSDQFQQICLRYYPREFGKPRKAKGFFGILRKSIRQEEKPFFEDIHKITTLAVVRLFFEEAEESFTLRQIQEELKKHRISISQSRMREIMDRLCLSGTFRLVDEPTVITKKDRLDRGQIKIDGTPKDTSWKIKVDTPASYSDKTESAIKFKYEFGIKIFPKLLTANFEGIEKVKQEIEKLTAI
jgi:hypothetical protein